MPRTNPYQTVLALSTNSSVRAGGESFGPPINMDGMPPSFDPAFCYTFARVAPMQALEISSAETANGGVLVLIRPALVRDCVY